jgi:hypothetical protein
MIAIFASDQLTTFEPQKCAQTQVNMIAPSTARPHLQSLDQTTLLPAAMIIFNRPGKRCPFAPLQIAHLEVIGGPQICNSDVKAHSHATENRRGGAHSLSTAGPLLASIDPSGIQIIHISIEDRRLPVIIHLDS